MHACSRQLPPAAVSVLCICAAAQLRQNAKHANKTTNQGRWYDGQWQWLMATIDQLAATNTRRSTSSMSTTAVRCWRTVANYTLSKKRRFFAAQPATNWLHSETIGLYIAIMPQTTSSATTPVSVMNAAARLGLIFFSSKYYHITPLPR